MVPVLPHAADRAVHANTPTTTAVADGLNHALRALLGLSRGDRRRGWVVAVDTHLVPHYGRPGVGVVGGPDAELLRVRAVLESWLAGSAADAEPGG